MVYGNADNKDMYKLPEIIAELQMQNADFKDDGGIKHHINFNKMAKFSLT